MKALSVTQPWGFLLLNGKSVENRRWDTKFRGEFLIHAAKGMTKRAYADALTFTRDIVGDAGLAARVPNESDLMRGGIIGRARLVDVIPPCITDDYDGPKACLCNSVWHMGRQSGFILEDAEPLPFHPYSGSLGFFNIPDEKLPVEMRSRG